MTVEELLATPGAELERGTFNDAVVVQGKWVARFPRQDLSDARRRAQAAEVLRRFADMPPARGFVHGDLAPVNLRWHKGKVSGIIDWDFACAGDPALDAAAFASYGWPWSSGSGRTCTNGPARTPRCSR